jgi:hypothetical protein
MGMLLAAQWQLHSGGGNPPYIEVATTEGETVRRYLDYSPLELE